MSLPRCLKITSLALLLIAGNGYTETLEEQESFVLNLKNADIHSLISMVSKSTGRNFIVDPRVKARVTVISADPVTASGLYGIFLSVLQVHGFATVPAGDIIKIVPDGAAKQAAIPLMSEGS